MALDAIDWTVLDALQSEGRTTWSALARATGLSVPAVTERVKRLQECGAITAFGARVEAARVGYGVTALIGITVAQPAKTRFLRFLEGLPEVLECHHVTGADSYVMKLIALDVAHLERLIAQINPYGETRTSIVMSTAIAPRAIRRPPQPESQRRPRR